MFKTNQFYTRSSPMFVSDNLWKSGGFDMSIPRRAGMRSLPIQSHVSIKSRLQRTQSRKCTHFVRFAKHARTIVIQFLRFNAVTVHTANK